MKLSIAGSGGIDLQQAKARRLEVSIVGSGDIDINNVEDKCDYASLSVAGSGDINAMFSDCEELKCSVAGSGEINKNELEISGNCSESKTNNRSKYRKKPRTVNNINAIP